MHLFIKDTAMSHSKLWLMFLCVCFFSTASHARIESLCELANPCSATGELVAGEPANVTITWRGSIISDGLVNATGEVISSNTGIYAGQNNVALGTNLDSIAENVNYAGTTETPFTIIETVVIPASVTRDAAAQGLTRIYYGRQFSGPSNNRFGSVSFPLRTTSPLQPTLPGNPPPQNNNPSGPSLGDNGIERLALRFEDNSLVKLIGKNNELRAELQINYQNAGPFAGRWEIATPATSYGEPFFQTLENVYTILNGSRKMFLQSPVLPTDMLGLYLVRFVPADSSVDADLLQLSYIVNESGQSAELIQTLVVISPQEGQVMTDETLFEWQSLEGSYVYRLEFYQPVENTELIPPALEENNLPVTDVDEPDQIAEVVSEKHDVETALPGGADDMVSGILVPGDLTKAQISTLVAKRLEQGQFYRWRIAAFDSAGRTIGLSSWYVLRGH